MTYDPLTSMTQKSRCSSVVEHFLGKEEVKGSIPFNGSEDFLKVRYSSVLSNDYEKRMTSTNCQKVEYEAEICDATKIICWLHNYKKQ